MSNATAYNPGISIIGLLDRLSELENKNRELLLERDNLIEQIALMNEEALKLQAERDALQSRIDVGIRVLVLTDSIGKHTFFNSSASNATLILDEGVQL